MTRWLLITGTDTGVGKTTIARAILCAAHRRGTAVWPLKPIETGCSVTQGGLVGHDAVALAAAAGLPPHAQGVCLRAFRTPAAPNVAARLDGETLEWSTLLEQVRAAGAGHDRVLVEGAGGLKVPITDGHDYLSLARALDAAVLVVARDALGTINHTRLTVDALHAANVPIAGIVLNDATGEAPATPTDHRAELIRLFRGIRVFGVFRYMKTADDESLADAWLGLGGDVESLWTPER